jgi:flagellar hook-length control protein FliK
MIDAIHATIELASRRGASQARIALQPEELGEIRIHLSQSADGIVARLTAATAGAAQALAAGRGELHQSLSSLGATLLRLDIGMFEGGEGRRQEVAGGGSSSRAAAASTEEDESIATVEGATPAAASGGTAAGALVDVLA